MMADAARKLELAGADLIAIGANTMHKVARQVTAATALPLIHIGDALAAALRRDARSKPLLLGTRYTMEDPFMRDHLGAKGIDAVVPDKAGRDAHIESGMEGGMQESMDLLEQTAISLLA